METKYHVFVRAEDGKHKISKKRAVCLEKAKLIAAEWLGPVATWMGEFRAVSMYGSVLTIEEKE